MGNCVLFEHTLWDLKLCFALPDASTHEKFEHTLWDLKLLMFVLVLWVVFSLNIPYGI